ncbi:hypothetical protein HY29_08355 [Hyphomonas beringensis]|uniref:Phosphatidate cytidylyltransferase n=1 Tax=Hyphomonas beringensis TaxID=1280946 RepID=A0A062UFU0_9PROT|nr:phosphatidate cytidylyltransferase [Hyphomonas beringensis]KCZ56583.1 hypothetical protein HY29_08355 [Hyphomonas beringensis]
MGDWTPPDSRFSQIGQRLLTALVLIPIGLAVVWYGGWWLAIACAVFAAIMSWEWARMSGHPRGFLLCLMSAVFCLSLPLGLMWLQVLIGVLGAVFAFMSAVGRYQNRLTAIMGLVYVTAIAAGLWCLREGPWDGREAALFFMSFVWASDASAYFVGRGLGGPRLIPQESPNKTWSGALGAIAFTSICGIAAADLQQSSLVVWMLAAATLSITAQAGDLLESGLKRRFHVKDSSNLLPGHGGVLDRVDGLGAVAVIGSLALWLYPPLRDALGFLS